MIGNEPAAIAATILVGALSVGALIAAIGLGAAVVPTGGLTAPFAFGFGLLAFGGFDATFNMGAYVAEDGSSATPEEAFQKGGNAALVTIVEKGVEWGVENLPD